MPYERSYDYVPGTKIVSAQVDTEFDNVIGGLNTLEAAVNNRYTKAETDQKINNASKTANVAVGTAFPSGPYTDGQQFYRLDLQQLYVYDSSYGGFKATNIPPVASSAVFGGVKVGANVTVAGDGTISIPAATATGLGVAQAGTSMLVSAGVFDVKQGVGSGLDADKIHGFGGLAILGGAISGLASFNGVDGDVVISTNTTVPRRSMNYNNLTINSAVTLTGLPGVTVICVKGRLTLNGTIAASALGAPGASAPISGAGKGGNGGGILIVIASEIIGTGKLTANGEDGGNATAASSDSDSNVPTSGGRVFGVTVPVGTATSNSTNTPGAGAIAQPDVRYGLEAMLYSPLSFIAGSDIGGSGGTSGATDSNTSLRICQGGGGGAGLIGSGSSGGPFAGGNPANTGSSGGAGGGGGGVVVYSLAPVPAITIEAKGGKGGNPYGQACSSGGGGGGFVGICAPSSTATIDTSGGLSGIKGGAVTSAGSPGGAGLSIFVPIS